ncbi:hypothetical protein [Streptomyces scopuliridis]|uniref:Uncharacterized protein n=1 Tax=Streptomyces scopuliridis TaxID=452529 RepID=A0ACD4ZCJ7_9ACTN|nr:hypothetical protein [Streptomyces scopuliridis]WSB96038.1 hypothetical protein OG835_02805 [Streptomyces scopuliridis]
MNIATTAPMNTGHHTEGPLGMVNSHALARYADRTSRTATGKTTAICPGGVLSASAAVILRADRW